MLQILIADDHPTIRMGIKVLLLGLFPASNIEEAEKFPEALSLLDQKKYDLLILDVNIPGATDIKIIDIIRKKQPKIPILIYTGADESKYALRYLKAGATGFLSKNATGEEHKAAFVSVMDNRKYVSASIHEFLLQSLSQSSSIVKTIQKSKLTPRETEISELLMQGKWTNEISAILGLKPSTVSTFKAKIFEKLDVKNAVELFKKLEER